MSQPGIEAQQQLLRDKVTTLLNTAKELARLYKKSASSVRKEIDMSFIDLIISTGLSARVAEINSINTQTPAEGIKAIGTKLKDTENLLVQAQKKYSEITSNHVQNRIRNQDLYNKMLSSIQKKVGSDHKLPPAYSSDKVLEESWKLLQKHLEAWSGHQTTITNMIRKVETSKDTTHEKISQVYSDGINALNAYDSEFNKQKKVVDNRIEALKNYDEAIAQRDAAVIRVKQLLITPQFQRLENDLQSVNVKDLNKTIEAVARMDYMKEAVTASLFNKKSPGRIIQSAIDFCNDDVSKLTDMLVELKDQMEEAEKAKTAQINQTIEEQSQAFRIIYDSLNTELTDLGLDSPRLVELRDKFNLAYGKQNTNNQEPLVFATQRLESIMLIVKELIVEQKAQKPLIQAKAHKKIEEEIQTIVKEMQDKSKAFLTPIVKGYVFNEAEKKLINTIESFQRPIQTNIRSKNIDDLVNTKQELLKKQKELEQSIQQLEVPILIQQAVTQNLNRFRNKKEMDLLVKPFESPKGDGAKYGGADLMEVMIRYLSTPNERVSFMQLLNDNLSKLDNTVLPVIQSFINSCKNDNTYKTACSQLQEKMVFLDLLSSRGVPKTFLNDPVALLLKSSNLQQFITLPNLENAAFRDAILKLQEHNIILTQQLVEVLVKDESKCSFIKEYNGTDKELIKEYINAGEAEVSAFNNFKAHIPSDCQLSLLKLIKTNHDLKDMLSKKPIQMDNIVFLSDFIKEAKANTGVFSNLGKSSASDLKKMGDFIKSIDLLISSLDSQKKRLEPTAIKVKELDVTLTALNKFRQDTMIVLMNGKPMATKQIDLKGLADKYLKLTDLWDRICEWINKTFGSKPSEKVILQANVAVKETIGTGLITSDYRKKVEDIKPKNAPEADKAPTISKT